MEVGCKFRITWASCMSNGYFKKSRNTFAVLQSYYPSNQSLNFFLHYIYYVRHIFFQNPDFLMNCLKEDISSFLFLFWHLYVLGSYLLSRKQLQGIWKFSCIMSVLYSQNCNRCLCWDDINMKSTKYFIDSC